MRQTMGKARPNHRTICTHIGEHYLWNEQTYKNPLSQHQKQGDDEENLLVVVSTPVAGWALTSEQHY